MTPSIDRRNIRSILIIKLRAVGDVLLSTVVTPNLRRAFPDARIDFLTERPSADILRGNPHITDTLIYDRRTMSGLELIRLVRGRRYDLVIDLFCNPRTALITKFSRARYRVGFRFRGRTYAYNIIVEPRGGKVHNTQFNLDALEAIGIPIEDRSLQFRFTGDDERFVSSFMPENFAGGHLVVGLSTGGGWYTKRWGLEHFAALADSIIDACHAHIVMIWGPGQEDDVKAVQALMKNPAFVPPATTLPQLGALLKRCSVVVSNDSGPMHIAAAVGTPVLGIFGPTNPMLQGPYGQQHVTVTNTTLDCLGCNFTRCPIGNICMKELQVGQVLEGFYRLAEKNALPLPGAKP